jgi:RNA polymerase sigma-70 factor (ECF subfamily)
MAEENERALIAEIRAGSAGAFEDLMKQYQGQVYRTCFGYTRNRDDALDVTQEVFVKVYERIDSFSGSGSFKGWLLRITHNQSLNWIRARARHGEHDRLSEANAPGMEAGQEVDLSRQENRDLIEAAMLHLNPKQRKALTLRYFERMSISEIASLLECTEGTARNILFRSMQKLRDRMVPHWRET